MRGMVELRIREVAARRGITNAYQLQKAMGTLPTTAARLWRGEMTAISFETIDALCAALDCEPGDLIVRVKAKKGARRKG
jgi:putative transcriptional regulator